MFPTVPENDSETYRTATGQEPPENAAPARTEPVMTPVDHAATPASDVFTVPEPAPAKPVEPPKPEPATAETFTHYVHLADGRVLRADLSRITEHIGNRYYENRGEDGETSTEIIGVYPR